MKISILTYIFFLSLCISVQAQQEHTQVEKSQKLKRRDAKGVEDLQLKPEEITHINFSRRRLTEFPIDLLKCTNIEELTLSFNEIPTIPNGISSLKKLKRLLIFRRASTVGLNWNYWIYLLIL